VELQNPHIIVPKRRNSDEVIAIDLGNIVIRNRYFRQRNKLKHRIEMNLTDVAMMTAKLLPSQGLSVGGMLLEKTFITLALELIVKETGLKVKM